MTAQNTSSRHCGTCTLCCKLLPVRELGKGSNERCKHQRHGKGCTVYGNPDRMPISCHLWSCRWLVQAAETADLQRPDRGHYVVDVMPDVVTVQDNETGRTLDLQAIQVWVDPAWPDAHKAPELREYLARAGREDAAVAIIRYSGTDSFGLIPPSMMAGEEWHESRSSTVMPEAERFEKLWGLGMRITTDADASVTLTKRTTP